MYNVQFEVKDFNISEVDDSLKKITPDFKNFVEFIFRFDGYWNGMTKVITFIVDGEEENHLLNDDIIILPAFINGHKSFKIKITGKKNNQLVATKVKLIQY